MTVNTIDRMQSVGQVVSSVVVTELAECGQCTHQVLASHLEVVFDFVFQLPLVRDLLAVLA